MALLLAAGCAGANLPRMSADPAHYEVRDTAEYESMLSGGEYALLVRDGVVLDSVDLFFGVHRLNNGAAVWLPVEPMEDDDLPDAPTAGEDMPDMLEITEYVVFDGRRRIPLRRFLPHFSDYFSSPSVVDGILYYWGLESLANDELRVYAQRYDARARRVAGCLLMQALIATDDRGHFVPPRREGTGIRFETFEHDFVVDPSLPHGDERQGVGECLARE